ncbi:NB-ARC domain-containing protein [Actinomadura sp. 6N118]|uniref:NB-ARC domain-containing protein n=1 Tax=Actinomadura sp. 6N118 TaxID=3375151 RepID=UPI00378CF6F8
MSAEPRPGSKPYRDRLRARLLGLGFDDRRITEQVCADLIQHCGRRPREAWRLANELSLDEAAMRFNAALGDPKAPMRKGRIWDYERWPSAGARPTLKTLRILARVYGTSWARLIDLADLDRMPEEDRDAYHKVVATQESDIIPDGGEVAADMNSTTELASWAVLVPSLEPGMVDRSDLDTLASFVADAAEESAANRVVAVSGPGGFGKTTLANQACHDPRVTDLFPEILWVETGEECTPARVVQLISDLCVHLDGTRPGLADAEQAGFHLARVLGDRRALLVIDNVWSAADLAPFLLGGPGCVRLVTTRNARVCPSRTTQLRLGPMSPGEIRELLGRSVPKLAHAEAAHLADLCGGWPLLATVVSSAVGQDVASGAPPSRAVSEAGRVLDTLGPHAFDVWDSDQRKNAIGHAITSSLRSLEEHVAISGGHGLRERYLSLAIFPPATPIPLAVLSAWWGRNHGWTASAVRQFCRVLADRSLIDAYLADRDAILLHDVFRSHLRHLVGDDWIELHRSVIDTYRDAAAGGWPDLGYEHEYMWRYLPYHLQQADLPDELLDVLSTPAYIINKAAHYGHESLVIDRLAAESTDQRDSSRWQTSLTLTGSGFLLSGLTSRRDIAATLLAAVLRSEGAGEAADALRHHAANGGFDVRWAAVDVNGGGVEGGHVGAVTSVAAQNNLVASCGEDGTVRLWDLRERRQIRSHRGHTGWVFATAISPDGQIVASAGDDGMIRLWGVGTGELIGVLLGHTRRIRALAFARAGGFLVSGAEDGLVCLWDVERSSLVRTMNTSGSPVWSVSIGCSDSLIVSAGEDEFLRLYDAHTGDLLDEKAAHRDWIRSVTFATETTMLVTGSSDRSMRVWSAADKRLALVRHIDARTRIRSVAASSRGDLIVGAGEDATLRAFTAEGPAGEQPMPPSVEWVRTVTVTPDRSLIAGCEDGGLRMWTARADDQLTVLGHGSNAIWSTAFADDARLALFGRGDGTIEIRSTADAQLMRTLRAGEGRVWSLAAERGLVATACGDGAIRLWALLDDWSLVLNEQETRTWSVAINRNGTRLAASSSGGVVRVWALPSGDLLWERHAHQGRVRSLAFNADGERIVTGGGEGNARIWHVPDGRQIGEVTHTTSWIRTVAISADGMQVAVGCGPGDIYVHDLAKGQTEAQLLGHSGRVLMLGFAADQGHLISAAADGTVRSWSVPEQRQLAEVRVDASLQCAAHHAESRVVLAGSAAGSVAITVPALGVMREE